MTVAIAWISGGQVDHQFMDSVVKLVVHDQHSNRWISEQISSISSPRIAEARSQIVDAFARTKAEWLLMVDTDMTFEPTMLDRLMEHADPEKVPILGGLCFAGGRSHTIFPTVYEEVEMGGTVALRPAAWYPKDELVKVGGTGAACLLVHRQVFAAMARPWPKGFGTKADGSKNPLPWFTEGLTGPNGHQYGEDIAFCMRAKQLGIPVHVHTGVKLGHVKRFELTEEIFEEWREHQEAQLQAQKAARPSRAERRAAARTKGKVHA